MSTDHVTQVCAQREECKNLAHGYALWFHQLAGDSPSTPEASQLRKPLFDAIDRLAALAQPATLTREQIIDMAEEAKLGRRVPPLLGSPGDVFYTDASYRTNALIAFVRAIEAKR